ncbi:MAG: spore coat protein U domain-containing protein, partial [Vulcanimicrobiaceae bacterium]
MKLNVSTARRFVMLAFAAAAISVIAIPARVHGATTTGTMNVTASVAANCSFSGGTLAFGAYDPVVTNAAAGSDLKVTDSATALSISCTKGSVATITLDNGTNSGG